MSECSQENVRVPIRSISSWNDINDTKLSLIKKLKMALSRHFLILYKEKSLDTIVSKLLFLDELRLEH